MTMRSQFTTPLLFILIFTLVLATAIQLAERPTSTQTLTRSPYLTQFSERDPWISRHARFSRAFLKQRRRFESFCRWVWDLVVVPEVNPLKEDIFHLRLLEDTVFLSAGDVGQPISAGSELHRRDEEDDLPDVDDDDHNIRDILRIVETELSRRIPSERRLVIEYLRMKLLDHEASLS